MDHQFIALEPDGAIGVVEMEIGEVVLDKVGLEPEAQDKPLKAVPGVELHDMPQDGVFADRNHRLGTKLGLFFETSAQAATQNEDGYPLGIQSIRHAAKVCIKGRSGKREMIKQPLI
jgi:hypothetical protein